MERLLYACEVSARRLTCSDSLRQRPIRLGRLPRFLFQQLIALIKWSGSCRTDRSMTSRPRRLRDRREHAPVSADTRPVARGLQRPLASMTYSLGLN
jgi:hypothetical protein